MSFPSPQGAVERYSPLYFLAALGAGGLAVTFFMWLLFWVPHPGQPVPVSEDVLAALQTGSLPMKIAIGVAATGIAVFAALHLRMLAWNIAAYNVWSKSENARGLRVGNDETQLLALPLTVAMSVNVGFILGLVFVPGLWSVVEYLFPLAMIAFLAIGVWALSLLRAFWGRVLVDGGFDCSKNNSFAQLLLAFALSMVGVGLAAPAAMSTTPWVAGLSYVLSSFFIVSALTLMALKLVLGMRAMMENGATAQSAPSLWIVVPILTVTGIAFMRQQHGLHVHMGSHATATDAFEMLTVFLSLQLAFLAFGWIVLSRTGYFQRFVHGAERSPGSYSLVCPGVALSVMLQFFINKGLVGVGLIEKFEASYWIFTGVAILIQLVTIRLVLQLNAKHFRVDRSDRQLQPAE